jgi:two-component system NtrC family response regulator
MANILIIDDDKAICKMLSLIVQRMGHEPSYAITLGDGVKQIQPGSFDVVFLDVNLPDGNGLDALPRIRKTASSPEVIIITGLGDPDGAELAIKNGAWDYVQKPFSKKKVTLQVTRALEYREEKKVTKPPVALKRGVIIGSSSRMKACLDLVAQAASSDVGILITGETGTGKELFARAIHDNSLRADKSFVVVDCAALPETLVESVLFGHERGAFTGADRAKEGLVRQAHGGTLFLDEVGELPLNIQGAFLRVLQEHRFRPVGGRKEVVSDFRLVAATNRDLDEMVKAGEFRSDLLFRLRSITIELPALREHPEDIKELALYYMAKLCDGHCAGTKGFSPEFFDALKAYHWPGNVRELVSTLERAIVSAGDEPTLYAMHLPVHVRVEVARASVDDREAKADKPRTHSPSKFPRFRGFREQGIATLEKQYLQDLMLFTKGNIQEACRISDLSRSRLYGLLKRHKVSKSEYPSA